MIGRILGNRYEIIELIGEGGMGLVYKAKCHLLNRYVAIKILRDEFLDDEDFIRKFKRESQAAASLSHPNILNIYDVGVEKIDNKEIQYIVMEYIKGKTLKDIIKEKGKLSLDETINYSVQIGEALRHAHLNHIVHRDIKPQNIMITEENIAKVTDFGIARAATSATMTATSTTLGSVHYISPEQARGAYTDDKSDIYSLGIVMYEMITGKLPYEGESPITVALKHVQDEILPPSAVDSQVPESLEAIILKSVEKKQVDRYNSVEDLLKDLNNLKNGKETALINERDESSTTKVIPVINDENIKDTEEKTKDRKKNKKKKRKKKNGGLKPIILGILLAFILVTGVFFATLRFGDIFQSEVIVPSLIGMSEEDAREETESKGLKFEVEGTTIDSDFEPGEVVNQNPKEGSKVKKGYTIKVTINEGDGLIKVPSLVNKSLQEAKELALNIGLKIEVTNYEYSDTFPENIIIRQEPEAFTNVEEGSVVNVIVSRGKEIQKVSMPDIRGRTSTDAINILTNRGLVVGQVKEEPNRDYEKGIVFWQSYEPGVELNAKTAVDILVSEGWEEELPEDDDEDDSNEESSISLNVSPLEDRESTEIKVLRKRGGNKEEVYRKNHSPDEGEINIYVNGKSGDEFEVYLDNIYQFTREKDE